MRGTIKYQPRFLKIRELRQSVFAFASCAEGAAHALSFLETIP
jgi:hypothetical protein